MFTLFEEAGGKLHKTELLSMDFHRTKWLDLDSPTDMELQKVSDITKIPLGDLRVYVDPNEVPRVIEQDHYTVIIFKSSAERRVSKYDRSTRSVAFLVSEKLIITIHQGPIPTFSETVALDEDQLVRLLKKGTSEFLFYLLEHIMRRYFVTLDEIEDQIEKIESLVLSRPEDQTVKKIFKLKRTLVYFQKGLGTNRDVFVALQKEFGKKISSDVQSRFRHLYYDTVQLMDVIATYRDILTGSLDVYLSNVNNNLNQVMKKMAAYGTLVLVPTFITGLYGMNFRFMPEITWKYGYAFAWFLIVFSVVVLIWYFRKNDWF